MGFGKDGKGSIIKESVSVGLLALATSDAIIFTGPTNLGEDFRILKTQVVCHITGLGSGEGSGLILGIANGNLSAAEIEESIEAGGPLTSTDRIVQEKADRFYKLVATASESSASDEISMQGPDGGSPIEFVLRWTFSDTDSWAWFFYNLGLTLTTGATARLIATHYGVWLV